MAKKTSKEINTERSQKKPNLPYGYTPEMRQKIMGWLMRLRINKFDYKLTSEETGQQAKMLRLWNNQFEESFSDDVALETIGYLDLNKQFENEIHKSYIEATTMKKDDIIKARVQQMIILDEAKRIKELNINLLELLYSAKIKAAARLMEIIPEANNVKQLTEAIVLLQNIEQSEIPAQTTQGLGTLVDFMTSRYKEILQPKNGSKIEDVTFTQVDQQGKEIRVEATKSNLITPEDY